MFWIHTFSWCVHLKLSPCLERPTEICTRLEAEMNTIVEPRVVYIHTYIPLCILLCFHLLRIYHQYTLSAAAVCEMMSLIVNGKCPLRTTKPGHPDDNDSWMYVIMSLTWLVLPVLQIEHHVSLSKNSYTIKKNIGKWFHYQKYRLIVDTDLKWPRWRWTAVFKWGKYCRYTGVCLPSIYVCFTIFVSYRSVYIARLIITTFQGPVSLTFSSIAN